MPANYIYSKILYLNNVELVELRDVLQKHGYHGKFLKKNLVRKLGLVNPYMTFIIFSKNKSKSNYELEDMVLKLKTYDCLQILGIVKKNILIVEKQANSENTLNFTRNYFFSKIFILVFWKKFILK